MRPRFFNSISILMLAAMLYATAGPQVCRAIMAADGAIETVKCCGDGSEPSSNEEPPSDAHESCPLHKLTLIELLPASHSPEMPEAPQSEALNFPSCLIHASFYYFKAEPVSGGDTDPPPPSTCSLFLVLGNIRR